MKKSFTLILLFLLVLSSCNTIPHNATNNESQHIYSDKVADYQITTIQTSFGEEAGPIVELQGEIPVFAYQDEDIQYARYITDLNRILGRESESWAELANEILGVAQGMCSKDSLLSTFAFEVNVSCEMSTENEYPAVTFVVNEVRGPGSGGERNYQIKYHTDDGTMIYRTLTETTRVY